MKESSTVMIYCDEKREGTFAVNNRKHKGLHYMIVDSEADVPQGFRATVVKAKRASKV
tara:strand:- start:190 stop:363 length:174 start_codon:yes stop_codon:yes gene_type:complete